MTRTEMNVFTTKFTKSHYSTGFWDIESFSWLGMRVARNSQKMSIAHAKEDTFTNGTWDT